MCELVPPGSAGVSGRLSGDLQIGGFALPSLAACGGAALGGDGGGTAVAQGVGGTSASPESPSPPQLLARGGARRRVHLETHFPTMAWQKKGRNKSCSWRRRAGCGTGRAVLCGHKTGEDGAGGHRLPEGERGGDTALVLQVP